MISPDEQEKRAFAVLQAVANARLEGGEVSGFALGLMDKWAQGDMGIEEIVNTLVAHYTLESSDSSSESPHHS